jgi:hypothetical protein
MRGTMEELPVWKQNVPATPHALLNDLVTVLVDFYVEHIRRDAEDGRLQSRESWELLRGFLIAGMQTYASICILLAEKRPKRLMMQASVLNRALFEILATILGILEDQEARTKILLRETHKAQAIRYQYLITRWGTDPSWKEYLDVFAQTLTIMGRQLGLAPEDVLRPEAIADEWPTPGVMIFGRPNGKVPPFVSGARHAVLKELYQFHYPHLSAQAHGRGAAMAVALLVDDPSLQWNPGHGESSIVATALLLLACIVSELQTAGQYQSHPKLLEFWTHLRNLEGEAMDLWAIRYEAILTAVG